jgi:hypothetical protein
MEIGDLPKQAGQALALDRRGLGIGRLFEQIIKLDGVFHQPPSYNSSLV